ncbi:MAG TPA: sigma-70 family RNA polymerase sigma factor [Candidatus Eisenbacteria bacterium]|nr:sigma-70 family RNA polymerase sigma factor [Candidatus Eisenbacteria bacterium]
MNGEVETTFLARLNENLGIAHQVCRTYFHRDAAQREELFQEILYQLWKSYPQFKGESKFSTWMYKVSLNTAITHIRRSRRTKQGAELAEAAETASGAPHPSEEISKAEKVQRLHEAIAGLSDVDKAIILLHLEEQSYEEISSITGLSRTNVSVRLVRIKRALKERLQGMA